MTTSNFTDLKPKIVLGIAAHPDDLDFGAAGTLAVYAKQGAEIHYLILTDGSKGTSDESVSPARLIELRQAEQRAALENIGGKHVHFLNYIDGELEVTKQLKYDVVKVIRQIKPDLVVTMDPSVLYSADLGMINHPDHRAAGQATLDAVFPLARDHLAFPELSAAGVKPHIVTTLLMINFNTSNFTVDISSTIEQKIAALKAHTSQMSDMGRVERLVRGIAEKAGKSDDMGLAEAFVRIDISS
jgi:LmbE family N-acetylglucosaminyl deacetylase